jgi:hypothetical protein
VVSKTPRARLSLISSMSFADFGGGGSSGGRLDPVLGSSYQRGAPAAGPGGGSGSGGGGGGGGGGGADQRYSALHSRVTGAVFDMNAAVHAQEKMVRQLGTRGDTHDLRERLQHSQEATRDAARAVSEDLAKMSSIANVYVFFFFFFFFSFFFSLSPPSLFSFVCEKHS